ncbi:MAG: hypothetical protein K2Q13_11050 [Nitrosomonas sp.]|uniref:hypothetical protein n=1 Tax=Nitrosomonas sp. TaxID=42353 RepID=UPI0025EA5C99|nr:hypothetical protein [Nitrosomonas sp.]MBY0475581.1 hypothetical protein [Nitrosomonas sp.]
MDSLQILIGHIIKKVEEVHDYVQIVFSDGTTLSIFNNYRYDGGSILSIEGKAVKSIDKKEGNIIITLADGKCVSIGMEDDDYNGPEAIVLKREGESPIVWS